MQNIEIVEKLKALNSMIEDFLDKMDMDEAEIGECESGEKECKNKEDEELQ